MAAIKFTSTQIERFSDRIENCLSDSSCRTVFEHYLTKILKRENLINILKLWSEADKSPNFDDDMFDYIDNVDGFNDNPLFTLAEPHQKVAYVKSECCRLFNNANILQRFIYYLGREHQQ